MRRFQLPFPAKYLGHPVFDSSTVGPASNAHLEELTPDVGKLVRVSATYQFGYVAVYLNMRDRLPSQAARAFAAFVTQSQSAQL